MAEGWRAGPDQGPSEEEDDGKARSESALTADAVQSWRTWLLTGHSGVVTDRRRLRGSHRGLKQMLVHGTGRDMPQSWKHFSGAMVRLAINDALNALPKDQTHVVWLAYFGGLSNEQIAARLGMSVGGVQRRLKQAFEYVSDYVEHGRTAGRRAVFAILGWLSLRQWIDALRQAPDALNHAVMSGALIVAGASAAVIVAAAPQPVIRPGIQPVAIAAAAAPMHMSSPLNLTGPSSARQPLPPKIAATIDGGRSISAPAVGTRTPPPPVVPPLPSPPPLPTPPPLP